MSRQNFFIFAYIVNCMTPLTIALILTFIFGINLLILSQTDPGAENYAFAALPPVQSALNAL